MKDLIEKILKFLPQYFAEFGQVFAGPKTFIGARNVNAEDEFQNALLFLALSLALVVLMTVPLQPAITDFWTFVARISVLNLISVAIAATVMRASWWLVGGRASAQSFFITYSYFYGVIIVIFSVVQLIASGMLKLFDAQLYAQVLDSRAQGKSFSDVTITSSQEELLVAYLCILGIGFVMLSVWAFIGWGAYRELNKLGRWHSFGALMISSVLTIPLLGIIVMVSSGLGL
jgi:hypothetical protein